MYEIDSPELRIKEENDERGKKLKHIETDQDHSIQDNSDDVSPMLRVDDKKRHLTPGYVYSSSDILTT